MYRYNVLLHYMHPVLMTYHYMYVDVLIVAAPSPELVERVRDLYHKRVPDVRFLIPVLIGLAKVTVAVYSVF